MENGPKTTIEGSEQMQDGTPPPARSCQRSDFAERVRALKPGKFITFIQNGTSTRAKRSLALMAAKRAGFRVVTRKLKDGKIGVYRV